MARLIIPQANGNYSIYSTITDNFILKDIPIEKYIEFRISEESENIKNDIMSIVNEIKKGINPYGWYKDIFIELKEKLK
jgi:hypothetical protein